MKIKNLLGLCALVSVIGLSATAQNPIIHNQFTADPTARVFNGKVYLFPSHDIKAPEGAKLRKDWFCMADYHVFSSEKCRGSVLSVRQTVRKYYWPLVSKIEMNGNLRSRNINATLVVICL